VTATPVPRPPRRRWAVPVLVIAGVLLLAAADRVLRIVLAKASLPTGAAQWIWEPRDHRDLSPAAFYAVRDFTLDAPPARARLLVGGDPEYILYLNGQRVGTGGWSPGEPLDVWEAGPLLQPGANRLLAEVRSDDGSGGFLLSLQDEAGGRQLVRSDESWRVFREHQLGVLRGWLPLRGPFSPPSVAASCWGEPPMGRWGRPRLGPVRPLLADLSTGRPVSAASSVLLPALDHVPAERPHPPLRLFDWGRQVTGYLLLDVDPSTVQVKGLLYTGDAPPQPGDQRPAAGIVLMAGRRTWMDARPRRFRYALVVGLGGAESARVQEVDPAVDPVVAAGIVAPPAGADGERGVLGIVPPPLRTPVEDEVWRQLQGVAGVPGRKDL
jgi:hypothetical protein